MRSSAARIVPALAVLALALDVLPASGLADVEALIKANKLDEAVTMARSGVASAPGDPDAHLALANALAAKGRTVRHVVDATVKADDLLAGKATIPAVGPRNPPRTEVIYDAALLEQATAEVREAVRLAPKRKDLRLAECFLLTDSGRIAAAAEAIRTSIAALPADPKLASDFAAFAVERARIKDAAGAASLFGVVAKAFPSDAAVQTDLGYVLAQLGRKPEAFAALDRAATLAPRDLRILRKRASAAMLLRDFRRARTQYQATAAISRDDSDRMGAAAAAIAADLNAAKSELQSLATPAASADPRLVEVAESLLQVASRGATDRRNVVQAKTLADGGKEILVLPVLHRALRANPGFKEAAALLAGIYRAFGFEVLADEVIRTAARPPAPAETSGAKGGKPAPPQTSGSSKR